MNALSKTGALLADANLDAAKTLTSGPWVAELKRATGALGTQPGASAEAETVLSGVGALAKAASLSSAKKEYITTVRALTSWAEITKLAPKLNGL